MIVIWLCPHPRVISPGKSNVEQETCFPALENMLRSQKHPLLQAGANPRILTSFNEIKRVKYFWNSSGIFWLFLNWNKTIKPNSPHLPSLRSAHQQTSLCVFLLGKLSPESFTAATIVPQEALFHKNIHCCQLRIKLWAVRLKIVFYS